MNRFMTILSGLLLLVFVSPVTAGDSLGEGDVLARLRQEMVAAINAGNIEKAITYFATDATLHVQGIPPIAGRDAIKQMAGMLFPTGSSVELSMETDRREVSGNLAYETGKFIVKNTAQKTPPQQGKFISVWKKGADNTWKLIVYSPSMNSMGM